MKTVLPLAASVVLTSATVADAQDDQAILAMGAYVPTDDISVSDEFYRVLFDRAPVIELPDFVAFNIQGGWFAFASAANTRRGPCPAQARCPICSPTIW